MKKLIELKAINRLLPSKLGFWTVGNKDLKKGFTREKLLLLNAND